MTKKAHAFIVTDNLAQLWYEGSTTPEYILHGSVAELIQKETLELIGVWQPDGVGGLHGYFRGHFIHWGSFDTGFPMFIRALNKASEQISDNRTFRHSTGLRIHNYGEHQSVATKILSAGEMEKLHMFANNSWMVNPHIPMGPGRIISSLKEFQPTENETLGEAVCRVLRENILDVEDILNDRCELCYFFAVRLAAVTGMPADWWMNKSYAYQSAVYYNDLDSQIEVYKLSQRKQS